MSNALAEGIRARLREIDTERDHLLALLALYEPSPNGAKPTQPSAGNSSATTNGKRNPFQKMSGGPTDRILAVVANHPGLVYSDVVSRALDGMTTTAENPARSIGSTLQSLVSRGRVERRDGKHYIPKKTDE